MCDAGAWLIGQVFSCPRPVQRPAAVERGVGPDLELVLRERVAVAVVHLRCADEEPRVRRVLREMRLGVRPVAAARTAHQDLLHARREVDVGRDRGAPEERSRAGVAGLRGVVVRRHDEEEPGGAQDRDGLDVRRSARRRRRARSRCPPRRSRRRRGRCRCPARRRRSRTRRRARARARVAGLDLDERDVAVVCGSLLQEPGWAGSNATLRPAATGARPRGCRARRRLPVGGERRGLELLLSGVLAAGRDDGGRGRCERQERGEHGGGEARRAPPTTCRHERCGPHPACPSSLGRRARSASRTSSAGRYPTGASGGKPPGRPRSRPVSSAGPDGAVVAELRRGGVLLAGDRPDGAPAAAAAGGADGQALGLRIGVHGDVQSESAAGDRRVGEYGSAGGGPAHPR